MQIHEVTAGQLKAGAKKIGAGAWDLTKGVASGIGDELETMAFGSPISRYDTSEPATEPSLELMKKATASLQGGPALTAQELKQVNDYRVSKGQKPITAANLAAATDQATTTTQSPEQIRKAKQAITAKAAQDQMAGKPPIANQPAAAATPVNPTVAQSPEQIRKAKQAITAKAAQDQMAGKPPIANQPAPVTVNSPAAPKVNPAAAPVPYTFNGRKLDPNNVKDAQIIATLQAAGVTSGYLK